MTFPRFEEESARKDAMLRRFGRLAAAALLVVSILSLVLGSAVGFAIGSVPATRTLTEDLVLFAMAVLCVLVGALEFRAYRAGRGPLARWRTRPAQLLPTAGDDAAAQPDRAAAPCRGAAAVVCFLLGLPTGAALLFLIEHRDRAQPVWLALAAAPALAAAAACDRLLRRPAAHRTTTHHPHHTHGGRPGQGRTHRTTDRIRP
ncbi:hypothetical protein [Kitasatospora cheerisanensis]|uniref:Uncharacterized protein n=1 Tax=Kitasatospora cheerisanensis KCTC 2395 TaxID=1348663 RepID=A0A066Z0E1_9ACTN|nr:hypothetical protein [Kitasatospora cheerisanensis]KDN85679.1 hypothetical protein KCH_25880 [Kitasatospora cheerisanensis KCTC 2395]